MASDYECPVCHRPLFSADEVCNGAFTERDHPTGVKAVEKPGKDYPLGDGPSFAHDVKPLEEELALAKAHPEYGIDTEAVEAALREARADAAKGET